MIDFDAKYGEIHRKLQQNSDLVKTLFDTARTNASNVIDTLDVIDTFSL